MDLETLRETPPWEWPEGTAKMLLDKLLARGTTESDCMAAAELASELTVINEELVDALLSILRSDANSESLRARAAVSLGPVLEHADTAGFDDPDEIPITEKKFRDIQVSLGSLFRNTDIPRDVRRRILEASVRAPEEWHQDAILTAYASDDEAWRLTAVFCMQFVQGFDAQILNALDSKNSNIYYEALLAAGNWAIDAAWPHVAALLTSDRTNKSLLLAAIDAAATIRPEQALDILHELSDSNDEDIVEAVHEAIAMAEGCLSDDEQDEDDNRVFN